MGNNSSESLLSFEELVGAVHGKYVGFSGCSEDFTFTSVATDSRNVVENTLFVPLIGENQDGHKYIPEALEKGASAVFITKSVYDVNVKQYMDLVSNHKKIVFIIVENNLKALQNAAKFYVTKFPKLIKIGITGSSGKTTVKELTTSILKQKYNVVATEGNFNSETGLPLSVFRIRKAHEVGVFEMGMNRENEIGEIARVLKPNYAIITNIGDAHIGILGSRENIATEKRKIFKYIDSDGCAFINKADDYASYLAEGVVGSVVYYGSSVSEEESSVKFIKNNGVSGSVFSYEGLEISLKLPGEYNFQNALAAIALARKLGLSKKQIKAGIENVVLPSGRSEIVQITTKPDVNGSRKRIMLFEDCYNANPDAFKKVLNMCSSLETKGRKIFVLGDMLELGDVSEKAHTEVGEESVKSGASLIIYVGKEMKFAYDVARTSNFNEALYFEDINDEEDKTLNQIVNTILDYSQDGDFVLLKASHGLNFSRISKMLNVDGGTNEQL